MPAVAVHHANKASIADAVKILTLLLRELLDSGEYSPRPVFSGQAVYASDHTHAHEHSDYGFVEYPPSGRAVRAFPAALQ
jgi:hypothetical protein